MTQRSGRVVCPRCGSNNFDTVDVCWKCASPLSKGSQPVATAAPQPPAVGTIPTAPAPTAAAQFAPTTPAAARGNPSTANWAAFWLGVLMPYFGAPIGLAFMMCDDRRRQEVGRWCLLWSAVGLVAHGVVTALLLIGMREYLMLIMKSVGGAAERGMGGGPMFLL